MHLQGKNIMEIFIIIAVIIFLVELLFNGPGLLIFIMICAAAIYYGKKAYYKASGKVFFWIGVGLLIITIMNTKAFKFILIAAIILIVDKWYRSRQKPTYHRPQFEGPDLSRAAGENIYESIPWFTNKWFGSQQTKNMAYRWEDINIQAGVGDTVIDLNYTVIPKDPPTILIRNIIGNIQIYVPYGVEVSVHHSMMFGSHDIFGHFENNTLNTSLHFQTADYDTSSQKVKIFTSMLVGKLEVKRV